MADEHESESDLEEVRRRWRRAQWSDEDPPSAPALPALEDTSGDLEFARRLQQELNAEARASTRGAGAEEEEVCGEIEGGQEIPNLASAVGRIAFNTAAFLVGTVVAGTAVLLGAASRLGSPATANGVRREPSQMEADEALARRLQAEEDARASPTRRRQVLGSSRAGDAINDLMRQLGGFEQPSSTATATTVGRRVNEIILPGFGNGIRLRLVSSRTGGAPAVVPLPIMQGGLGPLLRSRFPANHPMQDILGQELSYEELMELQERVGVVDRGATKEQIESIPTRTFEGDKGGSSDQGCCAICLEDYAEGQQMRTLPCSHSFHPNCIDRWLQRNRACPVCKKDVC